ncbi:GLPGLI family protein [Halpernia sp.]|uniref:GLPGLI family protein n=1 Tax=Halpernia sp. TaxID=2782209 RepID=UPI003A8F7CE0
MKKFFTIFLFATALFSAQNQRFIYNYTYIKDTLNKTNINKELMYLDINKEGSKFYSRDVFVQDSTMMALYEKQIKTTGGMNVIAAPQSNKGSFRNKIFKTYPKYEVSMETRIGRDVFKVSDDRPIIWKILPEKEKIDNWETQKATTEFGGRKWTAWFSTELPFQDGPYKFHGLPGLIVKMEDNSKTHQFDLKGVSKFKEAEAKPSEFNSPQKTISIDEKQYQKLFLENRNDPAKTMRQMISSGMIGNMKDQNGSEISTADFIKKIEIRAKENNAKDNNLIEIDLLKS